MDTNKEILESIDYAQVLTKLKDDVRASRLRAARAVNTELILLYHRIGTYILKLQKEQGWGSKVIQQLSKDLKSTFPDMKGFSERNLKYMRKFAFEYPDVEFVQNTLAQISWYHHLTLMTQVDDIEIRKFYIMQAIENHWSRDNMLLQIEHNLHEAKGKAVNNFKQKLSENLAVQAQQALKDPYIFDFLTVHDNALEKEIENDLVAHIEKFLVELGSGFAFVGRQYKINVSGRDYFIDLLFYNLLLHSYVVIELKAVNFEPEHKANFVFDESSKIINISEKSEKEINQILEFLRYKRKHAIVFDKDGTLTTKFAKNIDIILNPIDGNYSWDILNEFENDPLPFLNTILASSEEKQNLKLQEQVIHQFTKSRNSDDILNSVITLNDAFSWLSVFINSKQKITLTDYTNSTGEFLIFVPCVENSDLIKMAKVMLDYVTTKNICYVISNMTP